MCGAQIDAFHLCCVWQQDADRAAKDQYVSTLPTNVTDWAAFFADASWNQTFLGRTTAKLEDQEYDPGTLMQRFVADVNDAGVQDPSAFREHLTALDIKAGSATKVVAQCKLHIKKAE